MEPAPDIRKIAFPGDYLPRKCGMATFTSDLLSAVRWEFLQAQTQTCSRTRRESQR